MLNLAVTNSKKSVCIIQEMFFPEFCSPKLGTSIMHKCALYVSNYGNPE